LRENSEEKILVVSHLEIKGQEKKRKKGMIFEGKFKTCSLQISNPHAPKKQKIINNKFKFKIIK
jgi:hypothetical protein